MTPADYRNWKTALGFTGVDACRALGIVPNTDTKYSRDGYAIPLYIALACAAVASQIRPWPL
jgi:hypothetical protein